MMNTDDKNKFAERLKLFLDEKTYTYIVDIFRYNFNGFVKKIDENKILFEDDELGLIPIRIKEILEVTYSKKNKEEIKE